MGKGTFNVMDFGAPADGTALATEAIQKAIEACHSSGGGTVLVPPGEYLTDTLQLRDHVHLHLSAGARLRGSTDIDHYRTVGASGRRRGMLFAEDAENIAITGHGTIDGSGSEFMDWDRYHDPDDYDRRFTRQGDDYPSGPALTADGPVAYARRPGMLVVLVDCENIVISDITLADSPNWTLRVATCDDVSIRGITIRNNQMVPNSDGIHVTSSRNVRISDCDLRCGDDAVCVTGFGSAGFRDGDGEPEHGHPVGTCENVVVSNCVLSSRSSAVRVGYGAAGVRNCLFQNLVVHDSNRGLGVFVRDGGSVENVLFSNVTINTRLMEGNWWGRGEPIHISAVRRDSDGPPMGTIRNVRFSNIVARSESGILLYGTPESELEDLLLDNVQLTVVPGGHADVPGEHGRAIGGNFDLRPAASMEQAVFRHDIPGIYAQHIQGLTLRNCDVRQSPDLPPYHTAAFETHEVQDVTIVGCPTLGSAPER
ncbi:MAG: glycosyl hydrolase family 28 protein [Candidatus Brocadiia bacterium]